MRMASAMEGAGAVRSPRRRRVIGALVGVDGCALLAVLELDAIAVLGREQLPCDAEGAVGVVVAVGCMQRVLAVGVGLRAGRRAARMDRAREVVDGLPGGGVPVDVEALVMGGRGAEQGRSAPLGRDGGVDVIGGGASPVDVRGVAEGEAVEALGVEAAPRCRRRAVEGAGAKRRARCRCRPAQAGGAVVFRGCASDRPRGTEIDSVVPVTRATAVDDAPGGSGDV